MPGEQPQELPRGAPPQGGRWVTVLIVSVGVLALVSFSFLKFSVGPSMRLETCFQDVNGLHRGSKVKLAGVDIGVVREVRAQPDKACPGAVEMEIRTPYELRIPKDSVASADTAGLLGEAFLGIDVSGASGPPIQTGGQLPSRESVKFADQALRAIESLKKQLADAEKNCVEATKPHSGARSPSKLSPSSSPK